MRNLSSLIVAALICSCTHISGNGNIITEKRTVKEFDGVRTSGSIDIEVSNNPGQSVEIEADENIMPYIITETDGSLLDVHYKDGVSVMNVHAKAYVSAPLIKKLSVRGSGNIESKNILRHDGFIETGIFGSGNISATVDAPDVKAEISGSGNLSLQGRCKNFEGSISGSGDLKCSDLLSENADVSIFGSGNAHIYSSVRLKASTTGSGDIYYKGKPSSTDIHKTGSGNISAE
jgi:hypothetical protein